MDGYRKYEIVYYKLEDNFLRKYILMVDVEELLSIDIYQDIMDYPKYASECDMLFDDRACDRYFFKICYDFGVVDSVELNKFKERYDIINLKYSLVPNSRDELYKIEYNEVRYYKLITLIMGLLYYLGEINSYNIDECYDDYLKEINNVNQIISNLLRQIKDSPKLREHYNRIENCFETKMIREIDLTNNEDVTKFFDEKKGIVKGKVKKLIN